MGGYAVRLLGPPEVRQDGFVLPFKSRKALILLAYLTLEAHPCARETLAALLWPDSDPDVARSALRTILSQMRGFLGDRLTIVKQTVALTWTEDDDLDLRRLSAGDPDVWRGELLEGLQLSAEPFESWLTGQRETLRAQADRAFDQKSASLLDQDASRASEVATRWLTLDQFNEAAWRRLILVRIAMGQLNLAREAFETCRTVISSELSLDLSPETLALQARLRPGVSPAPTPVDLPAFLVGGPLVGRRAEFERLVEAYRLAATGAPRVVLLSGEPGIGKTRLAGELLAWAHERGAPLLRGRALDGASAPFAPLVEALRREAPALRNWLTSNLRAELARLLPEIYDSPLPEAEKDIRGQVLTALSAACLTLAPQGETLDPLVLLLDDIQWMDASSQDALLHLVAQVADASRPVLLLFTARTEYLGTRAPLSGWLGKVRRHLPMYEEALAPLNTDGTGHLLARSLPQLPAPVHTQLSAWLFQQTAGHPLYLTETLKSLLESGALREGRLDEDRLPQSAQGVCAAIGERLGRLTPASLALAQGAAVLSQGATFETLRGVADLDEWTALAGYEELLNAGLLLEHGVLAQLSHDRVRETLRDALSSPRRRLLHRRAFQVLEGLKSPPAVLARHALEGELRDEAASWFERAGEAAEEVGAYPEVMAALEMALSLIPKKRQHHIKRFNFVMRIFQCITDKHAGDYRAAFLYLDTYIKNIPYEFKEDRVLLRAIHAVQSSDTGTSENALLSIDEVYEEAIRIDNKYISQIIYRTYSYINMNMWRWKEAEWSIKQYAILSQSDENEHNAVHCENLFLAVKANCVGYEGIFQSQLDLVMKSIEAGERAEGEKSWREWMISDTVKEMYKGALCLGEIETAMHVYSLTEGKVDGFEYRMHLSGDTGMLLTATGDYEAALPYLNLIQANKSSFARYHMPYTASLAKCLSYLGVFEEAVSILDELSKTLPGLAGRSQAGITNCTMADAYFRLSNLSSAIKHYRHALLCYEPAVVLSSLKGIVEILVIEQDHHLAAYCLCAVLAGKVTRLRDRQQAEVLLATLRAHGPADEIETAMAKGAATSLQAVVHHVRAALAEWLPRTIATT